MSLARSRRLFLLLSLAACKESNTDSGEPTEATVDFTSTTSDVPTDPGATSPATNATDTMSASDVTDATSASDTTGGPPADPRCIDETGSIPDGFVGVDYGWDVEFDGGPQPYLWSAELPPGLILTVDPIDSTKARIEGAPDTPGDFETELLVVDADGEPATLPCGTLRVHAPVQVDHAGLLDATGGCVPLGDPDLDSLADLRVHGILGGEPDLPTFCALTAGRGNGSGDFDGDDATLDTHPPGVTLDADSCTIGGMLDSELAYGIYGFIATFTQSTSASTVNAYVPYCAVNAVQPPGAYVVTRTDTGNPATFLPGVHLLDPGEGVDYGTAAPDPKITVEYSMPCVGDACSYAYVFSYNTLSGEAIVTTNPNAKFPVDGLEGFTHAIRIADSEPALLDSFAGRAWVTNVTFDYCIAANLSDCGNDEPDSSKRAEKIRQNGNGSNYYFSLVLLPAD